MYRDVSVDLRDVVFLQSARDNVVHSLGMSDDVNETKPPDFIHTQPAAIEGKEQRASSTRQLHVPISVLKSACVRKLNRLVHAS